VSSTQAIHFPVLPVGTPLLLELPRVSDGLSIAGLPNPHVLFAKAGYFSGVFEFVQVNETSTADNQAYGLGFGVGSLAAFACPANCSPDTSIHPTTYSFVGPTAVPEPSTLGTFGLALLLGAGIRWKRKLFHRLRVM
jgi:hypothetical protein